MMMTMSRQNVISLVPTLDELRGGPPTVSVEQAARCLGVSRGFAYTMARIGALPSIKLGSRVRVPTVALVRMLEGRGADK